MNYMLAQVTRLERFDRCCSQIRRASATSGVGVTERAVVLLIFEHGLMIRTAQMVMALVAVALAAVVLSVAALMVVDPVLPVLPTQGVR